MEDFLLELLVLIDPHGHVVHVGQRARVLAGVRITHVQGAVQYDRASMTLDGRPALFQDVHVSGLGILIPVKRGSAIAFGLQPYSQVNYEISGPDTVDEKAAQQSLTGSGGLDVFYLAFASTIGAVQFGITGDFYFGLIRETWRVDLSSPDLLDTEDRVQKNFRGFGVHAGVQLRMKKWQLGLAAGTPVGLSGETRVDTRYISDNEPTPLEAKLPLWLGMGLAFQPSAQWVFSAEARGQQWGKPASADLLGADGVNSYTAGFGFEFSPGKDRLREGKGLHYRAGANYSRLPYLESNGNTIPEWTAAAGFGVPFNRGASRLDFAVEWGKRGSSANLVQENILRFSASINGSERWFQRRR